MLLSIQQPFNVNDVVEVGDHQGRVVRLTAREVVLLTFEGNHVRLPNATVFKSVTVNYTRNPRRLFCFDVGVGVQEDLVAVTRLGIDTLDAMNGVLPEPGPFARIEALGDFAVIVRFHGWVNQRDADFFKVQSEAIRLVKTAFDEAGIDMPEPTQRILTRRMEAPGPVKKTTPQSSAAEQAATIDVAPDGELEAQVEEDLAQSGVQSSHVAGRVVNDPHRRCVGSPLRTMPQSEAFRIASTSAAPRATGSMGRSHTASGSSSDDPAPCHAQSAVHHTRSNTSVPIGGEHNPVNTTTSLPAMAYSSAGSRMSAPSGGSESESDTGRPWWARSSVSIAPSLPTPLPPYVSASLFRRSRQEPPSGTPMR